MDNLSDPTTEFIKGLRKDARKRGLKIAKMLFDGDMAIAMPSSRRQRKIQKYGVKCVR